MVNKTNMEQCSSLVRVSKMFYGSANQTLRVIEKFKPKITFWWKLYTYETLFFQISPRDRVAQYQSPIREISSIYVLCSPDCVDKSSIYQNDEFNYRHNANVCVYIIPSLNLTVKKAFNDMIKLLLKFDSSKTCCNK